MLSVRKWKTEAASTADAPACLTTSEKWSSMPAPPEAMTGIVTASAMALVNAMS